MVPSRVVPQVLRQRRIHEIELPSPQIFVVEECQSGLREGETDRGRVVRRELTCVILSFFFHNYGKAEIIVAFQDS